MTIQERINDISIELAVYYTSDESQKSKETPKYITELEAEYDELIKQKYGEEL